MWPEDKFFVQRGEGPGGVPWVWIFQWTDYKRKRSDVLEPDSKIANLNRRQRVTESMDAIAGYDTDWEPNDVKVSVGVYAKLIILSISPEALYLKQSILPKRILP